MTYPENAHEVELRQRLYYLGRSGESRSELYRLISPLLDPHIVLYGRRLHCGDPPISDRCADLRRLWGPFVFPLDPDLPPLV